MLERLSQKLLGNRRRTAIENALALQRRGEMRPDGLTPVRISQVLDVEWRARSIHPWDRHRPPSRAEQLFREQCYADTEAALVRLFRSLPDVDVICFRVLGQDSDDEIVSGLVTRAAISRRIHRRAPGPACGKWVSAYDLNDRFPKLGPGAPATVSKLIETRRA